MKNFLISIFILLSTSVMSQVISQQMPVGSVVSFLGTTAPTGYLLADGSCVSQTTYAKLYSMLGTTYGLGCNAGYFKLPDFRGMFLRGAGINGINQTSNGSYFTGGSLGSYLTDMIQGHQHDLYQSSSPSTPHSGADVYGPSSSYVPSSSKMSAGYVGSPYTDNINGTPRTGYETRPASYSVNMIIKY